jgi:hypothetical protein
MSKAKAAVIMIDITITLTMFPKFVSFEQNLHRVYDMFFSCLYPVSQTSKGGLYMCKYGTHIL